MRTIAVLGLGYVGATSMACLARIGWRLIGVDVVAAKVDLVARGKSPIIEPGVPELLAEGHAAGLIEATTDAREAIAAADLVFVCVGTPSRRSGAVDMTYLAQAVRIVGEVRAATGRVTPVFVRSTSLPSVHEELMEALAGLLGDSQPLAYCVHPEFLREGQAVADFFDPPKIVYGCSDDVARRACEGLYAGIDAPTVFTDPATAALVKYADNCFHAVKVTFGNEIGLIANSFGADARKVMEIFCLDTKLNISPRYLKPGMPYGGSCLPKDLRGVVSWARQQAVSIPMIEHVEASNAAQVQHIVAQALSTRRRRIGMIGLAFKDDTDDLRESPMVAIAEHLLGKGRELRVYDNNLIPDQLIGANKSFALASLPHLEKMLVNDCAELVRDAELVIVARAGVGVDFAALPWRRDQVVFDLAGLPADPRLPANVLGLYWPAGAGNIGAAPDCAPPAETALARFGT